jgi:hypothetical protein
MRAPTPKCLASIREDVQVVVDDSGQLYLDTTCVYINKARAANQGSQQTPNYHSHNQTMPECKRVQLLSQPY